MKNLAIALLLLVSLGIKGQAPLTVPASHSSSGKPVYLVDSVMVNELYLNYINTDSIESINVIKGAGKYPDGAIFIKLKVKGVLAKLNQSKWLSLGDITLLNVSKSDIQRPVIYLLNDKLLTDTANVRIPAICLNPVSIVKASETPYFKTVFPDALLMMITTSTLPPKPPTIMIRGSVAAN